MDPKVTCLIGKNESGKSNILDFVSQNTLLKSISKDVYLKKHREFPEGSTSTLVFEFQLSDEEQNLLEVSSKLEKVEYSHDKPNPAISGAISEYFLKDTYSNLCEDFEILGNVYLNSEDIKKQFSNYCLSLKEAHQRISFNHSDMFNRLETIGNQIYFIEEDGVE